MIKQIVAGPGVIVTGSYSDSYISPGSQSAGIVRYNINTQNTEVYDGNAWLNMSSSPSISLSNDALEVLRWARKKMSEEQKLERLMEQYPGLRDTYEKFEIMKALCNKEEHNVAG
jgi:hypothetical protein